MIALALLLAPVSMMPTPIAAIETLRSLEAPPQQQVETWDLDQIRIATDTDPKVVALLEPLHTLDAIEVMLKEHQVRFVRVKINVIPNGLTEAVRAQILALPPGEPFVFPEPRAITISVLVGRKLPPGAVRWTPPRGMSFPSSSVSGA